MSHIWRAVNVSSLYRLSHGHVAEGHLLDFPCFWLEFPIDKSPLSPALSHRSLVRIKGRLWHGIKHAALLYIKVSPHRGCCIIVDFFFFSVATDYCWGFWWVEPAPALAAGLIVLSVSRRLMWPQKFRKSFLDETCWHAEEVCLQLRLDFIYKLS